MHTDDYSIHRAIFVHIPRTGGTSIEHVLGFNASHITIENIKERFPEEFNSYYKFTFVRNPWSRVVSWFRQTERHGISKTFAEFVMKLDRWVLAPQMNWIKTSNGEIPFDFIGRFERLNEDFKIVCDHLGIDGSLPEVASSSQYDYRSYYNDDLVTLVAEKYVEEIEHFNYEFG